MRLIVAGLFEVGWAVGLAYSESFSRLVPSVLTVAALAASMLLLAQAIEEIPLGTAYAVWTGIGVVGTALLGIALFDEPPSLARLGFIATILVGIVGLRVTGTR
jgi:quaternary ammonium compound-resistance protein SugE